jgi:hypothetical protein
MYSCDSFGKGFVPNKYAKTFLLTGKTIPSEQIMLISDSRKQLRNIKRKEW